MKNVISLLHEFGIEQAHKKIFFMRFAFMGYVEVILKLIFYHCRKWLHFILSRKFQSVNKGINVLHKSRNFLVVDKAYDIIINSNDPIKLSLQQQLSRAFPSLINPKLRHDFYFVHRLDYATSGVICVALNKKACSAATSTFEKRQAKKYYIALLRGHVGKEIIDVTASIGEVASERNGSHRMCTECEAGSECLSPRKAQTRLLVLQRGIYAGYPATKVLLRPITGRRHQLRVHCALLGHTIVGDFTYSRRKDVDPFRTFLHAFRLVLPNSVESLDIRTPDPFENVWTPVETINRLLDTSIFSKLDLDSEISL